MDPLMLALVKGVATSCVKLYLTYLVSASSPITYKSKDLGYKVPRWYMNPGITETEFYAYGTSVEGDEFQSITKAQEDAVQQMATTIRLANQKLVKDSIRFDAANPREGRMVQLFLKNEGLEDYVRANSTVDKKELVKVTRPTEDLRAFVRVTMDADLFAKSQEKWLNELKRTLMTAKTEDIMAELDADEGAAPPLPPAESTRPDPVMPQMAPPAPGGEEQAPQPLTVSNPGRPEPADREEEPAAGAPPPAAKPITATADDTFNELDQDEAANK